MFIITIRAGTTRTARVKYYFNIVRSESGVHHNIMCWILATVITLLATGLTLPCSRLSRTQTNISEDIAAINISQRRSIKNGQNNGSVAAVNCRSHETIDH